MLSKSDRTYKKEKIRKKKPFHFEFSKNQNKGIQ